MLLIGLTGGIGSGKSSVSARLAAKGAVIIDADAITRELQRPGTEVLAAMVERFGDGILAPTARSTGRRWPTSSSTIRRRSRTSGAIVHPAVGVEIARRLEAEADTDHLVVLDVPLLVESGRDDMAALVVVDVDPEVAVARLVAHRGMREADVRARMARQVSREERLAKADLVIDNSGTLEDLATLIDELWPRLLALGAPRLVTDH